MRGFGDLEALVMEHPLHLITHSALYALVAEELLGPALLAALPALILTTPNYC